MTVNILDAAATVSYTVGATPTADFAVAFPFDDATDLTVTVAGVAATFSLVGGVQDSGIYTSTTVRLTAAVSNTTVAITRDGQLKQKAAWTDAGAFLPSTVSREVSRLWMAEQDRKRQFGNALQRPIAESGAAALVIPDIATRAGKLMAFGADGTPTVTANANVSGAVVSSFMATVLDDITAAAARITLGAYGAGDAASFATLTTAGAGTVGGALVVGGTASVAGDLTVFGGATVTGNTSLGGTYTYFGGSQVASPIAAQVNGMTYRQGGGIDVVALNNAPINAGRANAGTLALFCYGAGAVGSIGITSTTTTFNTSSDYRRKQDVVDMTGAEAEALLRAMRPRMGRFKVAPEEPLRPMFLAHEYAAPMPHAVTGEKDGDELQTAAYDPAVPALVAALRHALDRIAALEAR